MVHNRRMASNVPCRRDQFWSRRFSIPEPLRKPARGLGRYRDLTRQNPKIPGVGTTLFAATLAAAEERNIEVINATIRADNTGGLAYYEKMGFRTYNMLEKVPLNDGTPVDRIQKQYQVSKDKSGLWRSAQ